MPANKVSTGHLQGLRKQGQSIWLDFIRRGLITSGGLKRPIDEDGLTGITSNPTIFEKTIDSSADYDQALGSLTPSHASPDPRALYDQIVIEDVRMEVDLLRSVYDESFGSDGFLSIGPRCT